MHTVCLVDCSIPSPVLIHTTMPGLLDCDIDVSGIVRLHTSNAQTNMAAKLHFHAIVHKLADYCCTQSISPNNAVVCSSCKAPNFMPAMENISGRLRSLLASINAEYSRFGTSNVDLDFQWRGNGWIVHPAIIDNALQLGPATASIEKMNKSTWVVAGIGFFATWQARGHEMACCNRYLLHLLFFVFTFRCLNGEQYHHL